MERVLYWPVVSDRRAIDLINISVFTILTAVGAFIYIPLPFTPVPLTMQVFFVLLSGGIMGRKAAVSQILYLAIGTAGLPVFSGAAGGAVRLLGPTGGYLVGFVAAAYVVGWMIEKKRDSFGMVLLAMLTGLSVIYLFGSIRLMAYAGTDIMSTMKLGVLPFLLGDVIKISIAAPLAWKLYNRFSYKK